MKSTDILKWVVRGYILLFFLYLFGPLIIMSASAFNTSNYPTITPWEGFTLHWFADLADNDKIINGLINSLWVGLGVVALSVPTGLAGAIMMMPGIQRQKATSKLPVWVAPSAPTMPARSMAKVTSRSCTATSCTN